MTINYPYLPEGREIKYVSADNIFMIEAKNSALRLSNERQHPTGAVIVAKGEIMARAGNKSALSNKKLIELHKNGLCVRRILKIPTGKKYWLCPGCASSKCHAEQLAVKDAKKKGLDIKGADLYLWGHWWCCKPCWDNMIEAGIKDVFLLSESEKIFNGAHGKNSK
ncbi:MAG TPA: deaminase [Candidatus Paceibacterota bacterium]